MTPNPSLSALLDSAIAKLATRLMSHKVPDKTVSDKILELCEAIKRATPNKRNESKDVLLQIIKTVEPNLALPVLITLVNVAPSIVEDFQKDKMVADRIKHIFRVAEIAQILSEDSLREIRGGIRAVQKRIFEVATR